MPLFKPKWKSNNPEKRLKTIETLDDVNILSELAINDEEEKVKFKALEKISDQKSLVEIAKCSNVDIAQKAFEKISEQKLLADVAMRADNDDIAQKAFEKISEQKLLAEIAMNAYRGEIMFAAVEKINDQKYIKEIACMKSFGAVEIHLRIRAIKKLTDQDTLKEIIRSDLNKEIVKAANEMIIDKEGIKNVLIDNFKKRVDFKNQPAIVDQTINKILKLGMLNDVLEDFRSKNIIIDCFTQAAEDGKLILTNKFIQAGMDVNLKNSGGVSALCLATSNGFVEITKLLVDSGAERDVYYPTRLYPTIQSSPFAALANKYGEKIPIKEMLKIASQQSNSKKYEECLNILNQ